MDEQLTNQSVPTSPESQPSAQIPPGALAILPLRNSVLFPYTVMPLTIGRPSSLLAVEQAVRQQLPIGVVLQREAATDAPLSKDLYEIGTTADVFRMSPCPRRPTPGYRSRAPAIQDSRCSPN